MQAITLHRDVIVLTSQLLQAHATIVRGPGDGRPQARGEGEIAPAAPPLAAGGAGEEVFVIDSPVLPQELSMLPSLVAQAGLPPPSGLLATHADWDHLLARIAFPQAALGLAESSVRRLGSRPGEAQRQLREFDQELYIDGRPPLSLGSVQALVVPGRCGIGAQELELHAADGHTADGMAVWIGWARVLVAGDYLSSSEIPTLEGGDVAAYAATLERFRPLLAAAEHVVPGHGPVLDGTAGTRVLEEDLRYLEQLRERGGAAELPPGRRSARQRQLHTENTRKLAG